MSENDLVHREANGKTEPSEREIYRAAVADDLKLHHQMLHELHRRIVALEQAEAARTKIVL